MLAVGFTLAGQNFMALNGGRRLEYSHAISFQVDCADQAELDRLWDALSDGGSVEQCGWLKDRHGVSWQIVPSVLPEMLADPDPAKAQRVMEALLRMIKIDIVGLKRAYDGSRPSRRGDRAETRSGGDQPLFTSRSSPPFVNVLAETGIDVRRELPTEAIGRKAQRMFAALLGGKQIGMLFKALNSLHDCFRRVLIKEHAGGPVRLAETAYRLQGATRAVSNYWGAAGLRFQGNDAEILHRREDERPGAAHVVLNHLVRLESQDLNIRCPLGGRSDLRDLRPVADDHQPALRHLAKRLHDQRHLLVWDGPRNSKIEVLLIGNRPEAMHVHGRMNNGGRATVELLNSGPNELGVGNIVIGTTGGDGIPHAQPVQDHAHEHRP